MALQFDCNMAAALVMQRQTSSLPHSHVQVTTLCHRLCNPFTCGPVAAMTSQRCACQHSLQTDYKHAHNQNSIFVRPAVSTSCCCLLLLLHTTTSCTVITHQGLLLLQLLWHVLHDNSGWPDLIRREQRLDEARCLEWSPPRDPGVHILQEVVRMACAQHSTAWPHQRCQGSALLLFESCRWLAEDERADVHPTQGYTILKCMSTPMLTCCRIEWCNFLDRAAAVADDAHTHTHLPPFPAGPPWDCCPA